MRCAVRDDTLEVSEGAALFLAIPRWLGPPPVAFGKLEALAQDPQKRHSRKAQLKRAKHDVFGGAPGIRPIPHAASDRGGHPLG